MSKVRVARDEGIRAWLFKGKTVIPSFGPHSKTRQHVGSQEAIVDSLAGTYATRPVWENRGEDPTIRSYPGFLKTSLLELQRLSLEVGTWVRAYCRR